MRETIFIIRILGMINWKEEERREKKRGIYGNLRKTKGHDYSHDVTFAFMLLKPKCFHMKLNNHLLNIFLRKYFHVYVVDILFINIAKGHDNPVVSHLHLHILNMFLKKISYTHDILFIIEVICQPDQSFLW